MTLKELRDKYKALHTGAPNGTRERGVYYAIRVELWSHPNKRAVLPRMRFLLTQCPAQDYPYIKSAIDELLKTGGRSEHTTA